MREDLTLGEFGARKEIKKDISVSLISLYSLNLHLGIDSFLFIHILHISFTDDGSMK